MLQRHNACMAQAIMNPEEVRRFASELKRFNDDVQARFAAVGSTWQVQEHENIAVNFVSTMKVLRRFVQVSEKRIPFLMRKSPRIEQFLDQR